METIYSKNIINDEEAYRKDNFEREERNAGEEETSVMEFEFKVIDNGICVTKYIGKENNVVIPKMIKGKHVVNLGRNCFENNNNLTRVSIPNGVMRISHYAFFGCSKLKSVKMSNSVKYIGDSAFSRCSSLSSIDLPSKVMSIGSFAFHDCSSLAKIEIPKSVTSMGKSVFCGCSSIRLYCEAKREPICWSSNWNDNNRPVEWEK